MPDSEKKQEKGGSLIFAGLAVWVAGLLVLFFPGELSVGASVDI